MSHQLWRYFLEDDLENFKKFLANAGQRQATNKAQGATRGGGAVAPTGSPSSKGLSSSPTQARKGPGAGLRGSGGGGTGGGSHALTRAELSVRDHQGLTLLHWITSSYEEDAVEYAAGLLAQPLLDLTAQDAESAWTALHRALYFGNITIARALLHRDLVDLRGLAGPTGGAAGTLIKIKDKEGNSPFDLYNSSIRPRVLNDNERSLVDEEDEEDDDLVLGDLKEESIFTKQPPGQGGDELFVFGSNKNMNLGVGDEDDRQFPERIVLKRPKHLTQRLRLEHMSRSISRKNRVEGSDDASQSLDLTGDVPALVQFAPVTIHDIRLSKLHTAVLTNDPEANLYMCGFGPGGRLGTGDDSTRFSFTCIYGGGLQGQKVVKVGLGQNHTLAVTENGGVFSWGSNAFGQLGYSVASAKDEEPVQHLPRQIFGPLKRDRIVGCAASRIHSVVFTEDTLYTFGKNEGQLGLVDSDARSLEVQSTPRAVAASLFQSPILQATAIDKATACMLQNADVWVFANYGYTRVRFPLDDFSNSFLRSTYATSRYGIEGPNRIVKICSGGDTICGLAREGQVFTLNVSQSIEPAGKASTTNPTKIRNALSEPQKVWSLRKDSMACADVGVGADGSVIICTKSGSVWRRVKRAKVKDANSTSSAGYKAKDYKFSRVPALTRISGVRSNAFGSFAAIRNDYNVIEVDVKVNSGSLRQDVFTLYPFRDLAPAQEPGHIEVEAGESSRLAVAKIKRAVLETKDIETLLAKHIAAVPADDHDLKIGSTLSEVRIPCNEFMLAGRSSVMRHGLEVLRESYLFSIPEVLSVEYDDLGKPLVLFQGIDTLTLFNIALYLYTDSIVDVWHYTRYAPAMTMRYKQVRVELMKTATALRMRELERAARLQVEPHRTLSRDLEQAYVALGFFEHADIEIELKGASFYAHRALLIQRCPFFEGMFAGRSGGGWIKSRYELAQGEAEGIPSVDLKHIEPEIFDLVLRHIYADTGLELFDEVSAPDLDAFLDTVVDVMSVANELMIDRLAQICQKMLGQFVNTRNVCQLLNAVAPSSVTAFKVTALEYICLNLEIMLENHLLDELDDDLMLELDEVVRDNQSACFSQTRRGEIADEALLDKYPGLAETLDLARRRKIDSMGLRAKRIVREDEERQLQASKSPKLVPKSPRLTARGSMHDLMFEMDDEGAKSPSSRPLIDRERRLSRLSQGILPPASPHDDSPWLDSRGKPLTSTSPATGFGSLNEMASPSDKHYLSSTPGDALPSTPSKTGAPWGSVPLRSDKLDMKQIMAQADEKRQSNISVGLTAQDIGPSKTQGTFKMSQKERKNHMQEQQKRQDDAQDPAQVSLQQTPDSKRRPSAWQTVSSGSKVSLKDVLGPAKEVSLSPTPASKPVRASPTPGLTMRQTIPGNAAAKKPALPSSPSTPKHTPQKSPNAAQPTRAVSSPQAINRPFSSPSSTKVTTQPRPPSPKQGASRPAAPIATASSPIVPRSVRHAPLPSEPNLQLSMADILAQQQLEKEVIREATAKRSLQEIQEEQAFQEWWDAEEKATKARIAAEEEAAATAHATAKAGKKGSRARRGGGNGAGAGAGAGVGAGAGGVSGHGASESKGRGGKPGAGRGGRARGKGAGKAGTAQGPVDHTGLPAGKTQKSAAS